MCVGNLSHGKNRETSHPQFLSYFPRQIRWSYLDIEIWKLVIRMTYPKDSCNQNGFHSVCSLLLFIILQQRGERDSQTQAILTKLKCAAGEQILQLPVLSACLLAVCRAFWQQCVPGLFFSLRFDRLCIISPETQNLMKLMRLLTCFCHFFLLPEFLQRGCQCEST